MKKWSLRAHIVKVSSADNALTTMQKSENPCITLSREGETLRFHNMANCARMDLIKNKPMGDRELA